MIQMMNDRISMTFKDDSPTTPKRTITIDKSNGDVHIIDDWGDGVIEEIRCDIFDLMSFRDIEKYIDNSFDDHDEK